jgi:peptidoglycan/xylan/chitin deacetylase (PgdA/CDA1 family)
VSAVANKWVAVLAYHKIGDPPPGEYPTWNYVPEATFLDHLHFLRGTDWEVMGFDAFLQGFDEPERLPQRTAVLTFDDGYRSMRTLVLPLLRRFDYPAVLFVPTDFVGRSNEFDAGIEPLEPICDWADLRELGRRGISVQSHGVSHRRLSGLSWVEVREEMVRSKRELEAGLDRPVEAIAYPYGDPGDHAEELDCLLEANGYRAGFLYGGGTLEVEGADRFRLTRLAMGPDSDLGALLDAE